MEKTFSKEFWIEIREIARGLAIKRSTIHGLPYVVDNTKSTRFRLVWFTLLFTFLSLHAFFTTLISIKYFVDPSISLNYGLRRMYELPFPATTICSPTFSRDPLNVNFTKFIEDYEETNEWNFTIEQQNILVANAQWCHSPYVLNALNASKEVNYSDLLKLMRETQLSLDEFMFGCQYKSEFVDCSKFFTRVLTDMGYCFTYNMQDFDALFPSTASDDFRGYQIDKKPKKVQWHIDKGYLVDSDEVYPKRATRAEELIVYLKIPTSLENNTCGALGDGFNFYFHMPNEIITLQNYNAHFVGYREDRMIAVKAKTFRTKKEVRKYPPFTRNCYFQGERKLRYYKQYTEPLCRAECLANYTLEQCGCVRFSWPRDNGTKICETYEDVQCMVEMKSYWTSHKTKITTSIKPCDCLNACVNIEYMVSFEKETHLDDLVTDQPVDLPENQTITRVKLIIFDLEVHEDLIVCPYNSANYVSDIGGLTGLFSGCSMISTFELFFFTFLHYRNRRRERARIRMVGEAKHTVRNESNDGNDEPRPVFRRNERFYQPNLRGPQHAKDAKITILVIHK